jgi:hypothetical protein
MTFDHLANIFFSWGWKVPHNNYGMFKNYLQAMLKKDRVLVVKDGSNIVAILIYYITDDYETLYKKGTWDIAEDNPEGHQFYIDKLVALNFTPLIHRLIKEAVRERFPNVTEAFYHREPKDRCAKIIVRRQHEVLDTILR